MNDTPFTPDSREAQDSTAEAAKTAARAATEEIFVFNGDADGLCALQQLRLAEGAGAMLVTGVKRDIRLLSRVSAGPGCRVTVLDVSHERNRGDVARLLAAGAALRYFDHHFAGELPNHPRFRAYIDTAPDVCTSVLVDRYLRGAMRAGPSSRRSATRCRTSAARSRVRAASRPARSNRSRNWAVA